MQWCSHYVTKEYVALVHGWVDPSLTEIRKRIRLDDENRDNPNCRISTRCTVSDSGKPAYTEVAAITHLFRTSIGTSEALNKVGKERYSLVVLKLHTGRTHQIRVHMLAIGHPLVCDVTYSQSSFPADRMWCPRNFLHAYHLGFVDVPESTDLSNKAGFA